MPDASAQRQSSLELGFESPLERETEAKLYAAAPPEPDAPALQSVGIDQPVEIMNAAWQEVMGSLQTELSGPTYQNYLRHVRPLRLTSDKLTLSAPSDFVKDWLVRRFARRIEETLEQFLGRPVILGFQIVPEGQETGAEMRVSRGEELENEAALGEIAVVETKPAIEDEKPATQRKNARAEAAIAKTFEDFEDFSSPLNKKYTFDNFIVGRSNYVSHAAAWAVANAPAKGQYNPLFIYGGVGLGKTHLMQAIGHHINKVRGNPVEIA